MFFRRKSIEEIILDISDTARSIDKYIRKEKVKDNNKLITFFQRIAAAGSNELERIKSEIGSENLVKMCTEAIDLSRQAIIDIEKSNYETALSAADKILDIESYLHQSIQSFDLTIYKKGKWIGEGTFGEVWYVKDKPNLIIKIAKDDKTKLKDYIDLLVQYNQIPKDSNIPRIIRVGKYGNNGKPALIMEIATGKPLRTEFGNDNYVIWKEETERLSKTPQEDYNRLVKDMNLLRLLNLKMDFASPMNIYYDESRGFIPIDLGKLDTNRGFFVRIKKDLEKMKQKEKERESNCLPLAFIPLEEDILDLKYRITDEDINNLKTILNKIQSAGYKPLTELDKELYAQILSQIERLSVFAKPRNLILSR